MNKDEIKENITEEDFNNIADIVEDIDNYLRKIKILDPAV
jgi:hypothetical protein